MADRNAVPTATVVATNTKLDLELEVFKDMWVVSLDDIEDLDAQQLVIDGGAYDLQPVPSPKTMAKFGFGDAVDEE